MCSTDVAGGVAENVCGTGGRTNEPEQHTNGGGLARAVGAEEAEHLAAGDREAQVVDGDDMAERLVTFDTDSEVGRGGRGHRR